METIKKGRGKVLAFLIALALAVGVFSFSSFLSVQVHNSTFLTQSRIFKVLLEEDSIELISLVTNKDKRKATEKFIAALTNAYVNFELIPINEGDTFTAVIISLNEGIEINNFAYKGRDLSIEGIGSQKETVLAFKENLTQREYFQRVELISLATGQNGVTFTIDCIAKETRYPELFTPLG